MKGVNASRIAAIGAGALLLSSSAIAAGLMYENVPLVNPNGQPTAKLVVGSAAQVSDGVAAANIAAVIANHAYKSSTLSAKVDGTATCSASGTVSGTGSCEVTDKKVTIEIQLPGVLGNAHQFKTLITDTLDKTLANRINTRSEDNYTDGLTTNDVSTTLSPLRAVYTGTTAVNLYRVSGNEYSAFKDVNVVDSQAGADFAYTAEQGFWVGSSADAVQYDSGSAYRQIVAKPKIAVYNMRFLGNDYGIPFCTQVNQTSANGDWSWCSSDSSSQYRTDNHRVKLPFLGSEWVISSMTIPTSSNVLNSSTQAYNGGQVKLAKEAKYDIINVGGIIDGGTFKIRLADISVATGATNVHPAIIDVLDANDAVIGQIQVNPGDTYTFTQSSTGTSIKVHVYRTAPGFTLNAKWAEMAIYTDEITLQDGQRYNLVSSGDANYNWKVSLLWKNRDYQSATSSGVPDSLREIVLYDEDTFIGKKYVAGDTYNFPAAGTAFRLTYNGLDLTDSEYVPVTISALSSTDYPVSNATSSGDCTVTGNKLTYTAKWIQFKTDGNYFGGSGSNLLGNYRLDSFYFDPIGGVVNSSGDGVNLSAVLNGSQANAAVLASSGMYKPQIFYRPQGFTCYINSTVDVTAANATLNGASISLATSNTVLFETAGSDSGAYGLFYFTNISASNSTSGMIGSFVYQEDAGKNDTISHVPVVLRIPFLNGTDTWRFKATDSTTANVYYHGIRDVNGAVNAWEPNVITERGSKVYSVGTTDYSMKVAKRIGQPLFTFSGVGANGTVMTGDTWIAKEGDSKTLSNGVKLTVKSIDETVGSCVAGTTGATPTCTVNMAPVSAKILPDNIASVEAVQMYNVAGSNLVITDKEASNAGGVVISVGGPAVNTVTKEILQDAAIDFKTTSVVVKAFGNKIVVAGNTAADTMQAANEFINSLQ